MSQLVEFYRGRGTDFRGRRLEEIWAYSDDEMEEVHDFIQWLFPLPEPSAFNHAAPLLSTDDIAAFHRDPTLRKNVQQSFARFLAFLGLEQRADGRIVEAPNFGARYPEVWSSFNHNWLRITRVLRSLQLLNALPEARALHDCLQKLRSEQGVPVSDDTLQYWTAAVEGKPFPR